MILTTMSSGYAITIITCTNLLELPIKGNLELAYVLLLLFGHPGLFITSDVIRTLYDWLKSSTAVIW